MRVSSGCETEAAVRQVELPTRNEALWTAGRVVVASGDRRKLPTGDVVRTTCNSGGQNHWLRC